MWLPNREINESVEDWHHHNDIVYYMEHDGAYTGVAWQIEDLTFSHLPAATLADLYPELRASQVEYASRHPQQTFQLYSYNRLMDWIDGNVEIEERRGGATLVFLNLPPLAAAPYSFYIEPQEDRYALRATAPAEVQYPEVTAADPSYQQAADVMAAALGGGLTQAKMLAALEVVCPQTTTVAEAGLAVPGAAESHSRSASSGSSSRSPTCSATRCGATTSPTARASWPGSPPGRWRRASWSTASPAMPTSSTATACCSRRCRRTTRIPRRTSCACSSSTCATTRPTPAS